MHYKMKLYEYEFSSERVWHDVFLVGSSAGRVAGAEAEAMFFSF